MSALSSSSKTDGDNAVHAILQCSGSASTRCSCGGGGKREAVLGHCRSTAKPSAFANRVAQSWGIAVEALGPPTMEFTSNFRDGFNGTVIGFSNLFNKMVARDPPEAETRKVRLSTEKEPK